MLREVLALGDKIDIKPLDREGKPLHNSRSFASQFLDFVESDVINIAAPIVFGKAVILGVGAYFNLCLYTAKGLYQCNCIVLSNHKEVNTIVSVVRIITNLEKYQRRQYYRLECILDIEYRIVSKEEEILEQKLRSDDFQNDQERDVCKTKLAEFAKSWISGTVVDLSGGGARYNSPKQHSQGDKAKIKFNLTLSNGVKKLLIGANLIASTKIMNRIDIFEHRVEFIEITTKEREDLIRFIFEQERRLRKNDRI